MTTALYRRYRPQDFAEVIGQEHVTEPLMQALRSGRVGHAYLFSGPRGCGKTTSARILARCLNCEQGPTDTPCGECDSCVGLATGGSGSVDVIEIDAASHGGVDDARDLREKAAYGPAQSRYKVYIIDEAHMVTPQGFNALLKIVEEPPEHVKFVFATTEPEKVIGTIRSRTHHYPFRLVPPARLQSYLEELCERENVQVEPGVLSFVVRAGGGSVRDSLSVLDQLMAGSDEAGLTYAGAAALLGFTENELLDACVDALAAGDGAGMFRQIDRVIETGQDPRRFVEDLLERFRDLIVLAAVSHSPDADTSISAVLRGLPEDQITRMRQQAGVFGAGQLSYAADIVNAGLTEMTGATSPRLQLELLVARLLLPTGSGEHGYAARLDRLERRLDVGGGIATPIPDRTQAAPQSAPDERAERGRPDAGVPEQQAQPRADRSAGGPEQRPAARPDGPESPRGGRPTQHAEQRGGGRPEQRPEATAPSAHADQRPARQDEGAAHGGRPQGLGAEAPAERRGAAPAGGGSGPRGGVDTEMIRRNWPDVLDRIFNIRRVTWTFLSEHAQVLDYDGTRLLLGLSTKGLATTFRNGPHGEVVRQALSEALGIDTRVEGIPASDAPPSRGGGGAGPAGPPPGPGPSTPPRSGDGHGAARREPAQAGQSDGPRGTPASGPPRGGPQHDPRGGAPGGDEHAGGPGGDHARPGGQAPTGAGERPRGESDQGPMQRRGSSEQGAHGGLRGQRQPGRAPDRNARGFAPGHDVPPPGDDDVPPPGDDDVPPEEESLPPDPGAFGGRAQASRSAAPARGADPAHGRGAPSGAQPDARDAGDGTGPAGRPQRPAEQTEVAGPGDDAVTRPAHPGAQEARAAIRAARGRIPAGPPADGRGGADAAPDRARADRNHDDGASVDDEDIADAGLVGQPVIADVLGGVVISDEEN